MTGLKLSLATFGLLLISGVGQGNVKLTLYYESLCPYCGEFIHSHIYPTFLLFGGANNNFFEAEFVPYGKAKTTFENGKYEFKCQHGKQECEGNRVHACALAKLPKDDSIAFVNCSMKAFNSPYSDPKCFEDLGLDYSKVESCLNSWEADTLLAAHGIRTHNLNPPLRGIPYFTLNSKYPTEEERNVAREDLPLFVCIKLKNLNINPLPKPCDGRLEEE